MRGELIRFSTWYFHFISHLLLLLGSKGRYWVRGIPGGLLICGPVAKERNSA